MIGRIDINGFQAHRQLTLELDPRVTTVVGPSDTGKSSVIRAVRWALLNVPVSSLIHDGCKKAVVRIEVDGQVVIRERGTENAYRLDGEEYRAFRTDVPQPVADHVNLHEVNFQGQHDPIYWFSSSAGDVCRQLNAVVNLDVIDKTLTEATRIFNRAKTLAEQAAETLSKSVADRDALSWIDEADEQWQRVESLESRCKFFQDQRDDLEQAATRTKQAGDRATEARNIAEKAAVLTSKAGRAGKAYKQTCHLRGLLDAVSRADTIRKQPVPDLDKLEHTRDRHGKVQKQHRALSVAVGDCHRLAEIASQLVPSISKLIIAKATADGIRDQIRILGDLVETIQQKGWMKKKLQDEWQVASDNLHDEVSVCPLCGQEMPDGQNT
jgi:hypothetical protein